MKLLIRLPNWLGDVVMSTGFLNAVRQLYPDAVIDVIIKKELSSVAALIPGINNIHSFSKQQYPGLGGVYRFGKSLRAENYDIFFTLPDSLSAALMGKATGAKKRIGFSKEGGFFLLTKVCRRPKNVHRVDEYLALLEQFTGKTITDKIVGLQPEPQTKNDLILLNFNSEAESRRMPLDKGKALLNLITQTFPNKRFGLIGSPKDAVYVEDLLEGAENTDRISNFCGKTTLVTLANLMVSAKVLLSTDSGPAHLANGVGLPVVALFGAGNEHNTAPYNADNLTVIRAGQLACEPCVRNVCKLYGIPKCMQLLDETRIINAMSVYLNHA
ncbi:glycosyltransferase family 9 protein [Mucilaginibacter auburnensis]|uniref:Lipopolysaccharide heptosyltransferase II n=1 Tax=Mucilaginibacter auburnensis TaxID=1457233 RepID=A0A2H9VP13_9SPHI|nr:glycosyltransferase family 9 protein [Mucilaginibacter auburnensis]PJJ80065.1 lipopolysaccharide heptosyltransferase II [Mucilaginibacter auburnensis]